MPISEHGAAAEQAERTVDVAFVRPLQKMRNDEAALARQKRRRDEMLGELIEPQARAIATPAMTSALI